MSTFGQDKTVVTCDQAIYDHAKGLVKKYLVKQAYLIIILTVFFTLPKNSWVGQSVILWQSPE